MSKLVPIVVVITAVLLYYCLFSSDGFNPEAIKGQRVLITGASSGIGEQLAYQYCKLGARVAIAARRLPKLEAVAQKCKDLGAAQVLPIQADLGRADDRLRMMETFQKEFSGLDQLVLNHAITSSGWWLGTHKNMTSFMNLLEVNFVSYVDLASQALDLLAQNGGRLGVVSSVGGKIPLPLFVPYISDKFAIQGFFGGLAQEQRLRNTGVSITLCIIGPVDTELGKDQLTEEQLRKFQDNNLASYMATAEDTAVAILRGVATRQREIYYGRIAGVTATLHKLFPQTIENYFAASLLEML